MKIKLDYFNSVDVDVSRMFVGKNILNGLLIGICSKGFALLFDGELYFTDTITIDTNVSKMDIRMAIGTTIGFDIQDDKDNIAENYKLTRINQLDDTISEYDFEEIEGISYVDISLSKKWLEKVRIQYEYES